MSAPVRLAAYGLTLLVVFALAFAVAGLVAPAQGPSDSAPGTPVPRTSAPGTGMPMEGGHDD